MNTKGFAGSGVTVSAQAFRGKHNLTSRPCPLCCAEMRLPPVLRAAVEHYEPPEVQSNMLSALVEDQRRTLDAMQQNDLAIEEAQYITKPIQLLGNVLNLFATKLSLY